jgi:hypothetical protein
MRLFASWWDRVPVPVRAAVPGVVVASWAGLPALQYLSRLLHFVSPTTFIWS